MTAILVGRAFATRYDDTAEPDWAPLEKVAGIARRSRELPPFHQGEFMHMACVRNTRQRIAINLYKHYDTRRKVHGAAVK